MTNSADPDQVASSQLIWIYTVYIDKAYPGSAGPGLRSTGLYFGFIVVLLLKSLFACFETMSSPHRRKSPLQKLRGMKCANTELKLKYAIEMWTEQPSLERRALREKI